MSSRSNDNGRVLEAILTSVLSEKLKVPLSDAAQLSQVRDFEKIDSIPKPLKERFELQSDRLLLWFIDEGIIIPSKVLEIHRFSDFDAQQGNVADVQIQTEDGPTNISVKNNHTATKHQRPSTVLVRLGVKKRSADNLGYLNEISEITDNFYEKAKMIMPSATLFRELKSVDAEFINRECYAPICALIDRYYTKFGSCPTCAENLLKFLVGSMDFYKVVFNEQGLCISNFKDIMVPSAFISRHVEDRPGYLDLQFDNAWNFSLRLHTASSRLGNSLNLKFDTQLSNEPITPIYVS